MTPILTRRERRRQYHEAKRSGECPVEWCYSKFSVCRGPESRIRVPFYSTHQAFMSRDMKPIETLRRRWGTAQKRAAKMRRRRAQ